MASLDSGAIAGPAAGATRSGPRRIAEAPLQTASARISSTASNRSSSCSASAALARSRRASCLRHRAASAGSASGVATTRASSPPSARVRFEGRTSPGDAGGRGGLRRVGRGDLAMARGSRATAPATCPSCERDTIAAVRLHEQRADAGTSVEPFFHGVAARRRLLPPARARGREGRLMGAHESDRGCPRGLRSQGASAGTPCDQWICASRTASPSRT